MKRIRYQVAMSLDGFIAGPKGEWDWIIEEPEIDFDALFAQFDTFLLGRRTFEVAGAPPGAERTIVFSRTLKQGDHPAVTIVPAVTQEIVENLRAEASKDLWLFGGGELFRSFVEQGLVDTVEVAVIPVLLGNGVPLLPKPELRTKLRLTGHHVYPSGLVLLEYLVDKGA